MVDYVKSTNFASKDSLPLGNPLKIVKGTEIDLEFNNIATAVATKANSVDVQPLDAQLTTLAGMDSSRATFLAGTEGFGFRNRIINGDMRIDQRNAGASVTPTAGAYTLDRWQFDLTQASKFTAQRNAGSVTPPAGFTNYLGTTSSSAYSVVSSDYFRLMHKIEGFNCADFAWGTASAQAVTLSFWVRSSLTGTFGGAFRNAAGNRSYPFSYTISSANTWEQKTIVVAGDTTGTWATDNTSGIELNWSLGAGSTFSGAAGAWAGSNLVSATGATSVVGTNGATFYITGVQLEAGSVATPFERRPYGTELALCQRYYEKSYDPGSVPGTASVSAGILVFGTPFASINNSFGNMTGFRFQVQKRATPTVTAYSYQGNAGRLTTGSSLGTELAAGSATPSGIGVNGASTDNASGAGITISGNALFFHYTASAEL